MSDTSQQADRALVLLDRVVRPVALFAGGLTLTALMVLTVTGVTLRYVFNSPIFGGDDFAQIFLLSTIAFAVAHSGRTGGQVAVEILDIVTGPRLTRWTDIVIKIIGAVMMAILTWKLIESGFSAADYGETTNSLEIPFGPFFWVVAFGMALYGIVLIVEVVLQLGGHEVRHESETSIDL